MSSLSNVNGPGRRGWREQGETPEMKSYWRPQNSIACFRLSSLLTLIVARFDCRAGLAGTATGYAIRSTVAFTSHRLPTLRVYCLGSIAFISSFAPKYERTVANEIIMIITESLRGIITQRDSKLDLHRTAGTVGSCRWRACDFASLEPRVLG